MKIKFEEKRFFVRQEDSIVCCLLYWRLFDGWGKTFRRQESKGIAKLNPTDTFDERIGKKVALAKAEVAAYKQCYAFTRKLVNEYAKELLDIAQFADKAQYVIKHNKEFIKTL